jgi:hypothetical protein
LRPTRLDADTTRSRLDPHLLPRDHAMQPTLVPDSRLVGPEVAEPHGREVEVVGLRNPEEHGLER